MRIMSCANCGSEKWAGRKCAACYDMNDEEWAVYEAQQAFVKNEIDVAELERRLEIAYTNPPKKHHDTIYYY